MTREEASQILEETAARLGEHFDNVQISASWTEGKITTGVHEGAGDWYARQALAKEFIDRDMAGEIARAVARETKEQE